MRKFPIPWILGGLTGAVVLCMVGCGNAPAKQQKPRVVVDVESLDRDTLYQVSTLHALSQGLYQPLVPLAEVQARGDFGLGTFEHLQGEMVQVDGRIYQVLANGEIKRADLSGASPFAITTFFESDIEVTLGKIESLGALQAHIDGLRQTDNLPFAIRVDGLFKVLKARSVHAQEVPYPPLADAVREQAVFDFDDVRGTLVGFWLPSFFGDVNLPGYHFHFVAEQREGGGHVLALSGENLLIQLDETPRLALVLPDASEAFRTLDLSSEGSEP